VLLALYTFFRREYREIAKWLWSIYNYLVKFLLKSVVMAKKTKKRRSAAGASKKVKRPSRKIKEKKLQSDLQKLQTYNNKKAEEQQTQDMMARQAALEKMGVPVEQQLFGYEDHRAIYNYSQERAPHHQPPIKTIDASVAPPEVTSYPEYPLSEFSSAPAFDIHCSVQSKRETVLNATATRDAARLDRAKKIFHLNRA
jgi:hypothetical protein